MLNGPVVKRQIHHLAFSSLRPYISEHRNAPTIIRYHMSSTAAAAAAAATDGGKPVPRRLRILLLHGYTQSGPLFHAKTRALEKALHKAFPAPQYAVSLEYPTAPIHIPPADVPGSGGSSALPSDGTEGESAYGWWRRKERSGAETQLGRGEGEGFVYEGIDRTFERVADYLLHDAEDGSGQRGFDGVVGFSQGACLAGIVASLLDRGRRVAMDKAKAEAGGIGFPDSFVTGGNVADDGEVPSSQANGEGLGTDEGVIHPPLKFAVSYSGFAPPPNPLYDALYSPKIETPMLHFFGSVDTVVDESRGMRLVDACDVDKDSDVGQKRIAYHPGGHFLPTGKMQMAVLISFIQESMGWQGQGSRAVI